MEGILRLVPFYCGSTAELLAPLAQNLTRVFGLPVERTPPAFDPEESFDADRGQYNSRRLLARLVHDHADCARVLGVTDVDLFIPVLTFVFGEAQLGGRAALVSSHRLVSERYGLPPDRRRLEERLVKEATHELGHTFGLIHCHDGRCVMASSPGVEAIDLKSDRFCSRCADLLARAPLDPTGPGPTPPGR